MPPLKIMNWNIEKVGHRKVVKAGGCEPIAHVIAKELPDIVCLVEVCNDDVVAPLAIGRLCVRVNELARRRGTGRNDLYLDYLLTAQSGTERYAFLIKDSSVVEPLLPWAGDRALHHVVNLQRVVEDGDDYESGVEITWKPPRRRGRSRGGGPRKLGYFPLADVWATNRSGRVDAHTTGQTVGNGGTSLGRGYRLPALAMFRTNFEGRQVLIPIVCAHYAAHEATASTQMQDLLYLHIAALYRDRHSEDARINVGGQATAVENLIYTGDFNVDFKPERRGTGRAYERYLSGILEQPPGKRVRRDERPAMDRQNPPELDLRIAIAEKTHLKRYKKEGDYPSLDALRDACYDNVLFGGPALALSSSNVVNLPFLVAEGELPIRAMADFYASLRKKDGSHGCQDEEALPLFDDDTEMTPVAALIGARLVSDHLPVVVEFAIP